MPSVGTANEGCSANHANVLVQSISRLDSEGYSAHSLSLSAQQVGEKSEELLPVEILFRMGGKCVNPHASAPCAEESNISHERFLFVSCIAAMEECGEQAGSSWRCPDES